MRHGVDCFNTFAWLITWEALIIIIALLMDLTKMPWRLAFAEPMHNPTGFTTFVAYAFFVQILKLNGRI